jgi:hypothetical protein
MHLDLLCQSHRANQTEPVKQHILIPRTSAIANPVAVTVSSGGQGPVDRRSWIPAYLHAGYWDISQSGHKIVLNLITEHVLDERLCEPFRFSKCVHVLI